MTEFTAETFAKAIENEVPTLVDFWASWCMPCKVFAPVLEEVASETTGKAEFAKINVDDFGELAQKYSISSIPTVVVFKNGKEVDRIVGVKTKDEVSALVEKHA